MDSARTRKVFGVKVGGGGEGFLCIVVFSVWQVLNAQGKLWVSFLMKPHMKPGAPHSTMRFRISGAINKAGRRVEWKIYLGHGSPAVRECLGMVDAEIALALCCSAGVRHTLAAVMSWNY